MLPPTSFLLVFYGFSWGCLTFYVTAINFQWHCRFILHTGEWLARPLPPPQPPPCCVRYVLVLLTRFGIGLKGKRGGRMGALAAADQAKLAPPSLHDDFLSHFCCRFIIMASVNVENCVRVCVCVRVWAFTVLFPASLCLSVCLGRCSFATATATALCGPVCTAN